jgi:hypothetical protein
MLHGSLQTALMCLTSKAKLYGDADRLGGIGKPPKVIVAEIVRKLVINSGT